jgi:HicA toxin of bacterial toxin-antitoxin,
MSTTTGMDMCMARVAGTTIEGSARQSWNDCNSSVECYHRRVNGSQRKVLERVLSEPINGNIEWARIESMLQAAGCRMVEGAGSSVTFEFGGRKLTVHRPHPGKEALRYRVAAVREFVAWMGIKP